MSEHVDQLSGLNEQSSLSAKLQELHQSIQTQHPAISRIAVVLYDNQTDLLKTFIYSSEQKTPIENYQAKLADVPQLKKLLNNLDPRVVNDLSEFANSGKQHTQALLEAGYLSSYTLPMIFNGHFFGFVFFNAKQRNVFDELVLTELDMVAHFITLLIYNERSNVRTLLATIKSALEMSHHRDPETGSHLERMSRFTRIIARKLASEFQFDDQFIEHIYLFAPLHDLGKITIPDRILLKPGKLTEEEFNVMKSHASDGKLLIEKLLYNYGLNGIGYVDMLKNIANHHHEAMDGSGYPDGLKGDDIPIEARIVAVADVFDALTSHRPYKKAWSNEKAIEKLTEMSGSKLDPVCVDALLQSMDEVIEVQQTFVENEFG